MFGLKLRSDQLSESIIVASPVTDDEDLPQAVRDPRKLKKERDRQGAAERLRRAGWSYRRIAETLAVPYITIDRWLSGTYPSTPVPRTTDVEETTAPEFEAAAQDTGATAPRRTPAQAPAPVAQRAAPSLTAAAPKPPDLQAVDADIGHRIDVLTLQFSAFETYVRDMAGGFDDRRSELDARQGDVLATIEARRQSLDESEARLADEMEAFRTEIQQVRDGMRDELRAFRQAFEEELREIKQRLAALGNAATGPSAGTAAVAATTGAAVADLLAPDEDDPFADDDPFAEGGDEDDPFAEPGEKAGADGEGPAAVTDEDDPFASSEDDEPLAEPTATAAPDPASVAEPAEATAAADEADPFAGDDDPFAGDDDPFAGDDDPFAGDDDPFK